MRLLIAVPDPALALAVRAEMENRLWEGEIVPGGYALLERAEAFDVLLVHRCLPGLDGMQACAGLAASAPASPPRILFISPSEFMRERPAWADCVVEAGVSVLRLCDLLCVLCQKPLPRLAAAQADSIIQRVEQFLDEIALDAHLKGRAYAAWLLERMVPSPVWASQPLSVCYASCAQCFHTTPASVERCLRVAVESVFMRGSMRGIERFFGATVDPERGKPTNRAFLMQAAQQLRLLHSRTDALSPNSSEMHHSPAAPTSV